MTESLVPDGVSVHRDVVHTRVDGFRALALDLYVPDAGARAVCVYAHGGGWRVGSRRSGPGPMSPTSSRWLARMALRGLAVAAVDYRLSGEARFPAQSEDIAAAIRWLREEADGALTLAAGKGSDNPGADTEPDLGVDSGSGGQGSPASPSGQNSLTGPRGQSSPTPPGRQSSPAGPGLGGLPVTVFGASAGGLLAALAALDPALDVAAAALWYPVTDIATMPEDQLAVGGPLDPPGESREELLIGGLVAELPEQARAASPVHQVHAGAPPFLLVHGDADVLVPPRQSERLHEALHAVGASATLEPVPGYTHMFAGMPDEEMERWLDLTATFLLTSAISTPT